MLQNQKVKITLSEKIYKVHADQSNSTPGIYKSFDTKANSFYNFEFDGLKKGEGDIKYWISDGKKETIYFSDEVPKYLLITQTQINVGVLFHNVKLNNWFLIEDIKINFVRPNNVQLLTSKSIGYFGEYMQNKYKLLPYRSNKLPTIFFGCYINDDLVKIKNHSGKKILLWGGTDALKEHNMIKIKLVKNLIHIAQSQFIMDDLKKNNIKCKYIPVAPTVNYNKFLPIKKGQGIYIYTNPLNQDFYGKKLYKKVIKALPDIKFYVTCNRKALYVAKKKGLDCSGIKAYDKKELMKVYSDCFVALRLTEHDGISATVQELGLMGIKTIHNGITPSCIKYNKLGDILDAIQLERKSIGEVDTELSEKVKNFLKDGDNKLINIIS